MNSNIAGVRKEKVNTKLISRSVSTIAFYDILSKIILFIVTIILIRQLTITEYAAYSVFLSISSFLTGILSNSLLIVYVKHESFQYSSKGKPTNMLVHTIISITFFHLILLLIALYFADSFCKTFSIDELYYYTIPLSIIYNLLLSLRKLVDAYFQVQDNYRVGGFAEALKNTALLLILFFFLINGHFHLRGVFVASIVTIVIGVSPYILRLIKGLRYAEKLEWNFLREYLKTSGWLLGFLFFLNLFNQVELFLIAHFLGPESTANYGVAFKYYTLLLTFQAALNVVFRVNFSKVSIANEWAEQRKFTTAWVKKATLIVLPLISFAILSAPYILPILNGSQYALSIPVFQVLCIGVSISYIFAPNINLLISLGKYKTLFALSLSACIIHFSGNFLFIPIYGILGAASMTVIAHIIINIGAFIFIKKGESYL